MSALQDKEAELAEAKAALARARYAVGYGQGDRTLQRASVPHLEASVARLSREVAALKAEAAGAPNGHVVVPRWT